MLTLVLRTDTHVHLIGFISNGVHACSVCILLLVIGEAAIAGDNSNRNGIWNKAMDVEYASLAAAGPRGD